MAYRSTTVWLMMSGALAIILSACGGASVVSLSGQSTAIANSARKPPPTAPYLSRPVGPAAPGALSRIPDPVATPFVMPTPGIVGPTQHCPPGLCLTPQGPFSPVEFTFTNTWQGYVGTTWVVAYAGKTGEAGNPAHVPAVRLMSNQFDSHGVHNIQLIGDFTNAAMLGMPTIVAESSSVLTLTTVSGQRFQFDMATHGYLR